MSTGSSDGNYFAMCHLEFLSDLCISLRVRCLTTDSSPLVSLLHAGVSQVLGSPVVGKTVNLIIYPSVGVRTLGCGHEFTKLTRSFLDGAHWGSSGRLHPGSGPRWMDGLVRGRIDDGWMDDGQVTGPMLDGIHEKTNGWTDVEWER